MKTNASQAHTQRGHARLSPSKAAQWSSCTASVGFIERLLKEGKLKPDKSSAAADEGTLAHEVAEALLLGTKIPSGATPEMIRHGKAYRDFCLELAGDKPWKVEAQAPLWYDLKEKHNGHVDFAAWDTEGAVINDYKFGKGQFVHAENNKQLAIYAAAILYSVFGDDLPVTYEITMAIYQPRCARDGVPYTKWTTRWDKLRLFVTKEIEIPASLILSPNGDHLLRFAPDDKTCLWCPARKQGQCESYARWLLNGSGIESIVDGDNPPRPRANELSDDTIRVVVSRFTELQQWLNGVYELAEHRFASNSPVKGLKQVKGRRPPRVWSDPKKAADYFELLVGDLAFSPPTEPKLLTPSQLEDVLREEAPELVKEISDYAKRGEPRVEIVPATDERPEVISPMKTLTDALASDDEYDFGV